MLDNSSLVKAINLPEHLKLVLQEFYTNEQIESLELTEGKIKKLQKKARMSKGHYQDHAIMICKPDNCPFRQTCFLIEMGDAPIGDLCPIELKRMQELITQYKKDIEAKLGFELDSSFITYLNMIKDLAYCDIMIARANAIIADDSIDGIREYRVAGVNQVDGSVIEEKAVSQVHEQIEKWLKRKDIINRQMVLTPEMEARLKKKSASDSSQQASEVKEKAKGYLSEIRSKDTIKEYSSGEVKGEKIKRSIRFDRLPPALLESDDADNS